jgi:26S proteasome regulatory subunit N2
VLYWVGHYNSASTEILSYGNILFRGLALGIALTVYGREEDADSLIEQLTREQDPILRYGGMYALGLAYRGTANNKAIHQLLHFAVSDVSDDVRRTAVLALGFVLYSEPEQVRITLILCFEHYVSKVKKKRCKAIKYVDEIINPIIQISNRKK